MSKPGKKSTPELFQNPRWQDAEQFRLGLAQELREVGIPAFDADHRLMLERIIAFHTLVEALGSRRPNTEDWNQIRQMLDKLAAYAGQHFRAEEELMRKHQFPELAEHVKEHAGFGEKFGKIRQRLEKGEITASVDLKFFLLEWLMQHINRTDVKYSQFFAHLGVQG